MRTDCFRLAPPAVALAQKLNSQASLCAKTKPSLEYIVRKHTAGGSLAAIKCPTLAMAGEGEGGETSAQFERYCRGVAGAVTRRMFTAEESADMHCQLGNLSLSNAVVYDWLSEVLR